MDGVQAASSTSTATVSYTGNLRVGYDNLTGWTPAASSSQFLGSVEPAVYSTTLTATDALSHHRAAS